MMATLRVLLKAWKPDLMSKTFRRLGGTTVLSLILSLVLSFDDYSFVEREKIGTGFGWREGSTYITARQATSIRIQV